ncbi:MAG: Holliday junction branch migration protein RuvA [Armatimonadetes bacterium]|nr:Holliday junction branch migration protein RuvA [Armatimonadota bacterium]
MISRLRGTVWEATSDRLVIDCGGVGYDVAVPEHVAFQATVNEEITLYTRMIVREDGHYLYGFKDATSRHLFDLLRDAKGCGTKTSLAIISTLGESGTITAIATQDAKALAKTSGVGPRLAERIIVELKDKIQEVRLEQLTGGSRSVAAVQISEPDDELIEALIALGYKRSEVDSAASAARAESEDIGEQVKIALKRLAK